MTAAVAMLWIRPHAGSRSRAAGPDVAMRAGRRCRGAGAGTAAQSTEVWLDGQLVDVSDVDENALLRRSRRARCRDGRGSMVCFRRRSRLGRQPRRSRARRAPSTSWRRRSRDPRPRHRARLVRRRAGRSRAAGPRRPRPRDRREKIKKKIRALRAYTLTEELSLDEATAGKLFPMLAKYDDELDRLLVAARRHRAPARRPRATSRIRARSTS